jgi:hypothetical protein
LKFLEKGQKKKKKKSVPLLGDLFGSFYLNKSKLNEKYVGLGKIIEK